MVFVSVAEKADNQFFPLHNLIQFQAQICDVCRTNAYPSITIIVDGANDNGANGRRRSFNVEQN